MSYISFTWTDSLYIYVVGQQERQTSDRQMYVVIQINRQLDICSQVESQIYSINKWLDRQLNRQVRQKVKIDCEIDE